VSRRVRDAMLAASNYTPISSIPLVDQLVAAGVALTDIYAYSPRKLYSAATKGVSVRRSNDNSVIDIGFDGSGNVNLSALSTHVGANTGTVQTLYEQAGNAANMTTGLTTREMQVINAGAVRTAGNNNRLCLYVTASDMGYLTTMPTPITNALNSAFMICSHNNAVTASVPRYLSLMTSASTGDNASASTGVLICRNSSSSPTTAWSILRNGSVKGTVSGTFGQLDQIAAIHDGTNATMWLNNATSNAVGSGGSFNATRLVMGLTGSTFNMLPGAQISELIFLRTAANSTIRNIIHADQASYYGVA